MNASVAAGRSVSDAKSDEVARLPLSLPAWMSSLPAPAGLLFAMPSGQIVFHPAPQQTAPSAAAAVAAPAAAPTTTNPNSLPATLVLSDGPAATLTLGGGLFSSPGVQAGSLTTAVNPPGSVPSATAATSAAVGAAGWGVGRGEGGMVALAVQSPLHADALPVSAPAAAAPHLTSSHLSAPAPLPTTAAESKLGFEPPQKTADPADTVDGLPASFPLPSVFYAMAAAASQRSQAAAHAVAQATAGTATSGGPAVGQGQGQGQVQGAAGGGTAAVMVTVPPVAGVHSQAAVGSMAHAGPMVLGTTAQPLAGFSGAAAAASAIASPGSTAPFPASAAASATPPAHASLALMGTPPGQALVVPAAAAVSSPSSTPMEVAGDRGSSDDGAGAGVGASGASVGALGGGGAFLGGGGAVAPGSIGRKQRRCWSPELHKRFLRALDVLGGPQSECSATLMWHCKVPSSVSVFLFHTSRHLKTIASGPSCIVPYLHAPEVERSTRLICSLGMEGHSTVTLG